MKRKFFIILFSGIIGLGVSGGVLFYLIGNNSATALTSSNVCGRTFTSGGVTASANDWCTDCPDGPYDFCDGNYHYRFSCKSGGLMGAFCDCDTASGGYEVCSGGCASWNCSKGYGCFGGSCNTSSTQTKTCAQLGAEWCQQNYTCGLNNYTSQVTDPTDKNSHSNQICCTKNYCQAPQSNNGQCKAYCQSKGFVGGKCNIGNPSNGACNSPDNGEWAFCSASQWREWQSVGVWGTGCIFPLECWCAKCTSNDSRCMGQDSDGGEKLDIFGRCTMGGVVKCEDKCGSDGTTINECIVGSTGFCTSVNRSCSSGRCEGGKCVAGVPPSTTCPNGQTKPHKECISGNCVSLNTCGINTCTTTAECAAPTKTCSQLGGSCCTGAKVCISGRISGASDCTECCPSVTNCVSGCALRCDDSDSGQIWDVKGTCKEGSTCAGLTTKGTDSCSTDGKTLTEWYCDGTSCKLTTHDCSPGTCSNGKCVAASTTCNHNNKAEFGEQCDGTDLAGKKYCKDLSTNFTDGELECTQNCTYDTSGCTSAPAPGTCPSLDGLTAPGITISGFSWDTAGGGCNFMWNGKVIPGFPSMASHIAIPYEWMVTAGFPSKLTATDDVKGILDKWYQLSFINNRLRYRMKYGADHPNLNEILSILSSPSGGICEGSGICDLIRKLISEEPLKALDLKLVMHSYNELKIHRAMVECILSGRCPPHTYGVWGYMLLGKCPPWQPDNCSWP